VLGYERTAQLVHRALADNRPVRELVLETGVLSPEEVEQLFDYERMTKSLEHDER